MRVADRSTARDYLKYLNKAKNDYNQTLERIASGNRFEKMSDDVAAGTRVLRARGDLTRAETQCSNVKSAAEELDAGEGVLLSISESIALVYGEKLKAGMSEEKGEEGRRAIANEVKAIQDNMLQLMNTKYNTRYLFGGSNASRTAPFSRNEEGMLLYNGVAVDDIQQRTDGSLFYVKDGVETELAMDSKVFTDIGMGLTMYGTNTDPNSAYQVSISGIAIFGFGKNEEGLSNNVFNLLTTIETNLREYNGTMLSACDTQLGKVYDTYRAGLTEVGAKSSFLESAQTRLEDMIDSYKIRINDLMGTNDVEETTNQAMNDYVLKAVLQMGSKILPVSLMDFLS